MNALEHDIGEAIWRSRGERRQSRRADFRTGWLRYWHTFHLSWMTVWGFATASLAMTLLGQVVTEIAVTVWRWL